MSNDSSRANGIHERNGLQQQNSCAKRCNGCITVCGRAERKHLKQFLHITSKIRHVESLQRALAYQVP
eukprot:scaffold19099_cov43-Attheya_sp.AAC.1